VRIFVNNSQCVRLLWTAGDDTVPCVVSVSHRVCLYVSDTCVTDVLDAAHEQPPCIAAVSRDRGLQSPHYGSHCIHLASNCTVFSTRTSATLNRQPRSAVADAAILEVVRAPGHILSRRNFMMIISRAIQELSRWQSYGNHKHRLLETMPPSLRRW